VAEWSCSGLQSRLRRFDSDPSLQFPPPEKPSSFAVLCWKRAAAEGCLVALKRAQIGSFRLGVDIVVTAEGRVVPTGRTKAVASVEVASVRGIFVTEGQEVKTGDPLLELDAREFEADERKATAGAIAARNTKNSLGHMMSRTTLRPRSDKP
jgi:multidrug efflux pump subunit AcrA (membrane-fusion protein)